MSAAVVHANFINHVIYAIKLLLHQKPRDLNKALPFNNQDNSCKHLEGKQ